MGGGGGVLGTSWLRRADYSSNMAGITNAFVQVNDLINSPPDPSQSLGEGLGGGLQALMGGGASLQSLLAGAHSNPQILEQLLSSGALSPIPPGMFEGIR